MAVADWQMIYKTVSLPSLVTEKVAEDDCLSGMLWNRFLGTR